MILGLGIDTVEIGRIRRLRERFGARFDSRVFTEAERAHALARPSPEAALAARFAAKEAAGKALGTGLSGLAWRELEITRDAAGKPALILHGAAEARARARTPEGMRPVFHVSLSHERGMAVAAVVWEALPPS